MSFLRLLFSPGARFLFRWTGRFLLLIYLGAWMSIFVRRALIRTDTRRDVLIYYRTAHNVRAQQPLYVARPNYGPHKKPFEYLYPPPFAAALWPWGNLDFVTFARLWTFLVLLSFGAFTLCLVQLALGRVHFWAFAWALAVFITWPAVPFTISIGQVDPWLWLALALAVLSVQHEKWGRAGWLLGSITLIKIYSFWPLLAAFDSRQRLQMWKSAALVLLFGLALGALVCGPSSYIQWAKLVLPVAGQGTFDPDNYSLSMAGLRLARALGWQYTSGPLQGWPKLWLAAMAIVGPLLALWFTRRLQLPLRIALVGCAAAWCAPLCWSTYLPLALVPLALCWRPSVDATRNWMEEKVKSTPISRIL